MSEVIFYQFKGFEGESYVKKSQFFETLSCLDRVTSERDAALESITRLNDKISCMSAHVLAYKLSRQRLLGIARARELLISELQQRLTSADERADVLEAVSVKQAALLDEIGIALDEVDDLFGETLKNAKRYEYLRSVMAVENFPAPHPAWSEPSEGESKRIDDLCDAALKPAEGVGDA